MAIDSRFTTTGFSFEGCRIIQTLGVVRGITVRSRSVVGRIGAGFQIFLGGNITIYTRLCERAREEAFNIMLVHAEEVGANGLIGVRYDAGELAPGVTEVLCYGTAVVIESSP
ncbi:MAG: YbjQ family protein [Gemmatimonadota bacterium]|nr:YbjQ family protein [Gemmatimonadota bacterium]